MPYHVSPDDFEALAVTALDDIPSELRARMDADNLMITIQATSTPDDRANHIDERVLGYYQGANESTFSAYSYPKRIVLLQGHIENYCNTYEELCERVRDTMLHEVGHYFGLDHGDIAESRLHH